MTLSQAGYKVMPRPRVEQGCLVIRAVAPHDIERIRQWRNAQIDVLRQTSWISPEEQERYFAENVWLEMASLRPKQILLSLEKDGEMIGYGGLVHINWDARRAEISFLLRPDLEQSPNKLPEILSCYLKIIYEIAFDDLGLNKLVTETYSFRKTHISVMESSGLRLEGYLRNHVLIRDQLTDSYLHGILSSEWFSLDSRKGSAGVLITSASKKVPLIHALQVASRKTPNKYQVIAADIDPCAIASYEADSFWNMPRLDDLDDLSVDRLVKECQVRDVSVIFPTRDGELEFWSQNYYLFARAGIEVIVSSYESISRCRDKLAFATFGEELGLPIIPAANSPEGFNNCLFVVKERYGAGSRRIGLGLSKEAALEHANGLEEPVFQPFIDGPEISIDSWVSKTGDVPGVVLRRRDVVVAGESQVTTTFQDANLEDDAIKVIKALQLRGPVVLQAIVTDKGLQIIECNPRFGGASTAAIHVGLDSLYWSLSETEDGGFMPVFHRTTGEIRQIRYPFDRVIHGSHF